MSRRIPCIYGDVGDIEIIERLHLKTAKMLISTVPDIEDNLLLIEKAKDENPKIKVIIVATQVEEAIMLYEARADYVVLPHFLGGDYLSILIEGFERKPRSVLRTRLRHLQELRKRKHLGHEHPHHD